MPPPWQCRPRHGLRRVRPIRRLHRTGHYSLGCGRRLDSGGNGRWFSGDETAHRHARSLQHHRIQRRGRFETVSAFRCGIGYDAHRLVSGRKLILGGVKIPHPRGLEGHSDADVLSHAVADAVLGALGAGDIGKHFPNTDESIRGISSIEILRHVATIAAQKNARVVNVDATVLAEAPKISPHIAAMQEKIANALGVKANAISIKATTNEGLGAIGRSEGMAAIAVASVEVT